MDVIDIVLLVVALGIVATLVVMLMKPKQGRQSATAGKSAGADSRQQAGRAAKPLPPATAARPVGAVQQSANPSRLTTLLEPQLPALSMPIAPHPPMFAPPVAAFVAPTTPSTVPQPVPHAKPSPGAEVAYQPTTLLSSQPTALLEVISGPDADQRFGLLQGGNRIGRAPGNHVPLQDPSVSGQHAIIQLMPNEATLYDDSSTNGTFVNHQQVLGPRRLQDGDLITVGQTTLRFRLI